MCLAGIKNGGDDGYCEDDDCPYDDDDGDDGSDNDCGDDGGA